MLLREPLCCFPSSAVFSPLNMAGLLPNASADSLATSRMAWAVTSSLKDVTRIRREFPGATPTSMAQEFFARHEAEFQRQLTLSAQVRPPVEAPASPRARYVAMRLTRARDPVQGSETPVQQISRRWVISKGCYPTLLLPLDFKVAGFRREGETSRKSCLKDKIFLLNVKS